MNGVVVDRDDTCPEHDTRLDDDGCWVCHRDAPLCQPHEGWAEME